MDVVILSRLQFALTVGFHYLFPPLTIGMGTVLVYLEAMYLRTRDPLYESAAKFWTSIFALNFAIGVATGIVLEFQFGTNWATYSRFVGDVFGSALAAEGIFAFFLESGFLAVLVFGWDRVSARMHLFATIMVALGSIFSSVWIVVANSWQQTPAGHHIVQVMKDGVPLVIDGKPVLRAEVVDFWAVVLNPSTGERLTHVLIGCFILGSFFIMSISAYYLLRGRHVEFSKRSFTGALMFATVASLAALLSGHSQARMVSREQPAKLAAFEGHFQTGPGDLSLVGVPNDEAARLDYAVAIPGGLSFLVDGRFDSTVVGLDKFRPEDRPPTLLPFATYHLMVACGMFFVGLTLLASFWRWRGRLFDRRWLLWVFVFAVVGPVLANEGGWVAAEVGRQPWAVYPPLPRAASGELLVPSEGTFSYDESQGLRTRAAVSRVVGAGQVLGSIVGFGALYLALLAVWLFVLDSKIRRGPDSAQARPDALSGGTFLEAAGLRPEKVGTLTDASDE